MIARYDVWLQWVLRRQGATLVVALLTLALTVVLYIFIPKGLFPTQDTGQAQGRLVAAQDVSFERMSGLQQEAVRAILQDPDVASLSSFVGWTAPTTPCSTRAACSSTSRRGATARRWSCGGCATG